MKKKGDWMAYWCNKIPHYLYLDSHMSIIFDEPKLLDLMLPELPTGVVDQF